MKGRSLKGFFRSHLLDIALVVAGGIVAGVTLYCDIVSLCHKAPLVQYRLLVQWRKPEGMSILPPIEYRFNPPGGLLEPLSTADIFSLHFPVFYLLLLLVEVVRYCRWKRTE